MYPHLPRQRRKRGDIVRRLRGPFRSLWVYFWGGAKAYARVRGQRVFIEGGMDGTPFSQFYGLFTFANTTQYGGGVKIAPGAACDGPDPDRCPAGR